MWKFWEYSDGRGRGVFSDWRDDLPKLERARLDEKMRALETMGLAVNFLKSVRGFPHLRKLRIVLPDQNLRPLLCLGPVDMHYEFTMLIGAREQDFDWDPPGAREEADRRRDEIKANPSKRIRYEVPKS